MKKLLFATIPWIVACSKSPPPPNAAHSTPPNAAHTTPLAADPHAVEVAVPTPVVEVHSNTAAGAATDAHAEEAAHAPETAAATPVTSDATAVAGDAKPDAHDDQSAAPAAEASAAAPPAASNAPTTPVLARIERDDGAIVEILAEGTGRTLNLGDTAVFDFSATVKDVKPAHETKPASDAKPVHEAKAATDAKPAHDAADSKDAKSSKDAKESKDSKESKDAKDSKGAKDAKETKEARDPSKPFASTRGWVQPCHVQLGAPGDASILPALPRALEGLKVGTHARIELPPALAYGKQGLPSAGVPADATLVFDVHVISAK